MTPPRGKPPAMKALALLLYAMGNVSFGSIARILGVSDVAVLNWVRDKARKPAEPSTKAEVVVVTLDEMWHFVKKTEKLWVWRAYDPIDRRTIAWGLGRRDDATRQKLLDKIGVEGKTFVTDDWEGYHRLILEDQLFTGKDLTVPIEQDNSNIRHFLARFRRRTKVVSKVLEMVDLSLRIYHHFHDNLDAFTEKAAIFRSIVS
jgi:insertion element IS1 protein InsB